MSSLRASLEELASALQRFPRVPLAALPTPLEECPRLGAELGGVRIFVKRDDLTGLAFGGNKVRNLEFRMGHALAEGADTVLLAVEATSNSARQTAAAANKLGLDCVLFLRGEPDEPVEGNLLIDHLLGAEIHLASVRHYEDLIPQMEEYAAFLRRKGRKPHILNTSPMFSLGPALGYALGFAEIAEQCASASIIPSRVYITSGGRSLAGLALGMSYLHIKTSLVGVSAVPGWGASAAAALRWAREAQEALESPYTIDQDLVFQTDAFAGPEYGVPDDAAIDALKLVARTEGLLLDPVYTAKGMRGLIEDTRRGAIRPGEVVVFVHTGGLPALFRNSQWLPR